MPMTNATSATHREAEAEAGGGAHTPNLFWYFVLGCLFGIVLIKAEVISWFRIQEMFRFQAFHMYGIIGSAVATAMLSIAIIKRAKLRTLGGDQVTIPPKVLGKGYRYWIGGSMFGIGWVLTGSCPGPMIALTGAGVTVYAVAIASAFAGAWMFGYMRPRLPM